MNPILIYWIYGSWGHTGLGPMWFVFTLLVCEFTYVAYRYLCKKRFAIKWKGFTWGGALLFILCMGILAFFVRLYIPIGSDVFGLQLGFFPLYMGMYFLGIVASRNQWLERLKMRVAYIWIAIVLLVCLPSLLYVMGTNSGRMGDFAGGWNLCALFYAMWEPVMCVGISYFLLACGERYFNVTSPLIQRLSRDSYAFYIIHPFVVVGCVFAMDLLPVLPIVRLALVCIVGIPLCFLLARVFRLLLGLVKVRV